MYREGSLGRTLVGTPALNGSGGGAHAPNTGR